VSPWLSGREWGLCVRRDILSDAAAVQGHHRWERHADSVAARPRSAPGGHRLQGARRTPCACMDAKACAARLLELPGDVRLGALCLQGNQYWEKPAADSVQNRVVIYKNVQVAVSPRDGLCQGTCCVLHARGLHCAVRSCRHTAPRRVMACRTRALPAASAAGRSTLTACRRSGTTVSRLSPHAPVALQSCCGTIHCMQPAYSSSTSWGV
jgi:hypothetical protein